MEKSPPRRAKASHDGTTSRQAEFSEGAKSGGKVPASTTRPENTQFDR